MRNILNQERVLVLTSAGLRILDSYQRIESAIQAFRAADVDSVSTDELLHLLSIYRPTLADCRALVKEHDHFTIHQKANLRTRKAMAKSRRIAKGIYDSEGELLEDEISGFSITLDSQAKAIMTAPLSRQAKKEEEKSLIPETEDGWTLPPAETRTIGDYHELLRRVHGAISVFKITIHETFIANDPTITPEQTLEEIIPELVEQDYLMKTNYESAFRIIDR